MSRHAKPYIEETDRLIAEALNDFAETFGHRPAWAIGKHEKPGLSVQQDSGRTAIQVPAEEGESTWWRHRTGSTGQPGMVTFTAQHGDWSDLTVIH